MSYVTLHVVCWQLCVVLVLTLPGGYSGPEETEGAGQEDSMETRHSLLLGTVIKLGGGILDIAGQLGEQICI